MCTQKQSGIRRGVRRLTWAGAVVVLLAFVAPTTGQIIVPGADGSDGAFAPPSNVTIDLALADTQPDWETAPNPNPGEGVYDPMRWAVIYRYESVNIASGRYVYFTNHPSRAPVVWLVSGDVTISGNVILKGQDQDRCNPAEPGPGGFRGAAGGRSQEEPPSDGWGPGGGIRVHEVAARGGSFGTTAPPCGGDLPVPPTYGSPFLVPLIGGSGGSSSATLYPDSCRGGGAGGGAILIAAVGTIAVNGSISARGGGSGVASGGSGGAIRLLADKVQGSGTLTATGGDGVGTCDGGAGRIAVNANTIDLSELGNPRYYPFSPVSDPPVIWLASNDPIIAVTHLTVEGRDIQVPQDPRGQFAYPAADVLFETQHPVIAHIAAWNVPLNWTVKLRVVPLIGPSFVVTADPLQGTLGVSSTTATIDTMPRWFGAVQVRAYP